MADNLPGALMGWDDSADEEAAARSTLQPLTAALLECVTPEQVVATVVERGLGVLGARAGLVALLTADGQQLEIVEARGYDPQSMKRWTAFPVDSGLPLSDVVRTATALYIERRADWQRRYPAMLQETAEPLEAAVSLPLVARQRVFGAIHFSFRVERDFSRADRAFLDELARQCALALDAARLLEDTVAARERQAFLASATSLLTESLDYQSRLESLAHLCIPFLADWSGVDIVNEDGRLQRLAVAHRDPEGEPLMREAQRRFPAETQNDRGTMRVIRTGERLFVPDITPEMLEQADIAPEYLDLLTRIGLGSILCLPLKARDRIVGAITLGLMPPQDGQHRRHFTPETIELAAEVARRAAGAVDAARLFKAAEDAREQTETVLQSIGDMFYAMDSEWRVTYINRRTEALWNCTAADVIGKVMWDLFPAVVGNVSYDAMLKAMETRKAVPFEVPSVVTGRWVEGTAYPAEDGGVCVYFHDIHERKTAEESARAAADALRRSEHRYRRLLETALEGILFLDPEARIYHANPRLAAMLGYDSPDDLIGRDVYFLFFPEDEERARDSWGKRIQGVQEEYELRLRRRDGSECWAIAHVSIERDQETDEFLGTFTMLTDITDRRRAQREVESKNEEIVTIFERVNDAFSAFDHEWRFTYLNREAESILGRSREELLGKCLWDEFEGARETLVYQEYTRAVREQVTASFEVFYGPLRGWFEVHAYPSPSGMSAYFRNVTERKLAELEREKAAEEKSRLLAELQQAAVRQRRFLREMLSSLTEGRLCLCDAPEDLPPLLPESEPQVDLAKRTLRALRAQVEAMAGTIGLERERVHDFVTAVGEASMNAVVHAGGGTGQVQFDKEAGVLRVWIRDQGKGIAEDAIHRATLERGFSSSGTLGHGFWMMLKTADYIYLLTTPTGTTVVLEQRRFPMEPAWLQAIYK